MDNIRDFRSNRPRDGSSGLVSILLFLFENVFFGEGRSVQLHLQRHKTETLQLYLVARVKKSLHPYSVGVSLSLIHI